MHLARVSRCCLASITTNQCHCDPLRVIRANPLNDAEAELIRPHHHSWGDAIYSSSPYFLALKTSSHKLSNLMGTTPAAIQNLARQLLALDQARAGTVQGDLDPAARACEKLRLPLAKLAGAAGFASLLSRALALAKRQAPALDGLKVEPDGSLTGIEQLSRDPIASEAAQRAGTVLVGELLGLLVTFIGASLTLRLVREAWPDISMEAVTLRIEDQP